MKGPGNLWASGKNMAGHDRYGLRALQLVLVLVLGLQLEELLLLMLARTLKLLVLRR